MHWRMLLLSPHLSSDIGKNEKKNRLVPNLVLVKVQLKKMS